MTRDQQKQIIAIKYRHLSPLLNERSRRCWAATEVLTLGRGSLSLVCEVMDIDHKTVQAGLREIEQPTESLAPERIRRPGGGRKKLSVADPGLNAALNQLVEPTTRGDPESPLRWTCLSTSNLAEILTTQHHSVSRRSVGNLLHAQHYSLQSNRKTREGLDHPDRDAQFHYLNESVTSMQTKNQPIISVDTKKKEVLGNLKNNGPEWRPQGKPREVNTHDFPDPILGKVAPYGVYDLSRNEGWVNVGIDHDTATFAAESIRRWWRQMGQIRYPEATELLITADSGGSNSRRSRLWKVELQTLADELKITIHVRHFPPGTSKWNKIEHRLFSFISKHWKGQPLIDRATVVNLIANTKTKTGLTVKAILDENLYETGKKISDQEMESLSLKRESFHGEWNYRLEPRC